MQLEKHRTVRVETEVQKGEVASAVEAFYQNVFDTRPCGRLHPKVDGEITGPEIPNASSRTIGLVVGAVEAECLSHLSRGGRGTVKQSHMLYRTLNVNADLSIKNFIGIPPVG